MRNNPSPSPRPSDQMPQVPKTQKNSSTATSRSSVQPSRLTFMGAVLWVFLFSLPFFRSAEWSSVSSSDPSAPFNPMEMINHHILDAHSWHFWDGAYGTLYLPVILYSSDRGVEVFSSHKLETTSDYKGYRYLHGHIVPTDSHRSIYDFSITKNVAFLFIVAGLLLYLLLRVGTSYARNPVSAPRGLQSAIEPIVLFVRDDIVRPCIGPRYGRYLPYMLTLFFFILLGNLMGLLPGAANLTGNIAFTATLAFGTFLITNLSGNRNYWQHIFNMPGIPVFIKPLMVVVECIGIFTKPISLTIRLFVAITAGHIVILCLLSLIFIFHSYAVGVISSAVVVFISLIEILVSIIQAYVFTMFSSLYIGMAIEEHH